MQDSKPERWRALCALASVEYNPEKLALLIDEITRLLAEREERLKNPPATRISK